MFKLPIISVMFILVFICGSAQVPDKSRVMDFFEHQQYEEAVNYLQPLLAADSNNQQLLAYHG